jgi:regulator of protease activity HflC (stomatin/prohibitin superfamily)
MILLIIGIVVLIVGYLGSKANGPTLRYKGIMMTLGVLLIIIGMLTSAIRQINPGHIGVQVFFGKVQKSILYEGLSFVNPLMDIKEMSIQTQNYTMSATNEEGMKKGDDAIRVLSKDGLEVIIDLTVLYKILPSDASIIFREIGLDYQDKIIRPVTRTGIRESASYYNAVDLFAEKRDEFQDRIRIKIDEEFKKRGLVLEQMLVRDINLPKSVKESIERKITANQDAQRMEYVLQKETQEAERKRVEAQGVADAQKIVNSGLSDKILQFEMIKVQKELATSPNSKIILMGGGKGGVPFIIGDGK